MEEESNVEDNLDDYEFVGVFEARQPVTHIFRLRLQPGELGAIEIAARSRGLSIGEFIRQAALREAAGTDEDTIGLRRLLAEATRAGAHLALIPNAPVEELPLPAGLPEASGG